MLNAPNLTSDTKVAINTEVTVSSGTQVRYKLNFANQASSKQCRVLGVALVILNNIIGKKNGSDYYRKI